MLLAGCAALPTRRIAPTALPATAAKQRAAIQKAAVALAPSATPVARAQGSPTKAPSVTVASTSTPKRALTRKLVATATPQPTRIAVTSGKPRLNKVLDGLDSPVYLTSGPAGSGVLYVIEQPGRIRLIENNRLLKAVFLDIEDRVGSSGNEQGLLGMAFAPDFRQLPRVFVNYTDKSGNTIVSSFAVTADGRSADVKSEQIVIEIKQPYANHNGGQIKFGPDNMLYIGTGDGGSAGDPQEHGQNVESLLGKMLRIDVRASDASTPYLIPDDNPVFGDGSRREIWSVGLRNPWRFSFDRATGDLYIADVGQNAIEEVNFQPAGRKGDNYGWKLREGTRRYSGERQTSFIEPVAEYEHGPDGCSITGGYVYRGAAVPALAGAYVYGDFCSGKIWALTREGGRWRNRELMDTGYSITSFGEDAAGELYLLDRGDGAVYRFVTP